MPTLSSRLLGPVLRGIASAGLALALLGCASLPARGPVPPSQALALDDATPLARLAAAAMPADPQLSGLRLLADGLHALDARLALIRHAQRSLDLQYYVIASDEVGLLVLRELRDAARRGVRVRLLLDDLHTTGQDALLAGLAAEPNVEVRLFNPLPARGEHLGVRLLRSLHEFGRINHRMHNKLFIADNALVIAGGRNIANEYFMLSPSANFVDIDVLAAGPLVRQASALFDGYWNSEHAWPVQRLVPMDAEDARAALAQQLQAAAADVRAPGPDRFGRSAVQQQLAAGRLALQFAPVRVLVDAPAKAAGQGDAAHTAQAGALAAMQQAGTELLIVSPYFVPGEAGMALLQDAAGRAVRLTVMTNSLGATDEAAVHGGYARYRKPLLKLGVRLLELGASLSRKAGAFGDFGASLGRLHAKVAVIDQRQLIVGSINMDRRSARYNTEFALLIDSPALAAELRGLLACDQQPSAYRVQLDADDRLEWHALDGGHETVHHTEPETRWSERLGAALKAAVLAEDLL